jgi:hypothetical protein
MLAADFPNKTELTDRDGLRSITKGTPVRVVHADGKATDVFVNPPPPARTGDL